MKTIANVITIIGLSFVCCATATEPAALPRFAITANDVRQASLTVKAGEPMAFVLVLTDVEAKQLAEFTGAHIGQQVVVTVAGIEMSSPVIQSVISNPTLTIPVGKHQQKFISILNALSDSQK